MSRTVRGIGYRTACSYGGGWKRVSLADAYRPARLAMGPDTDRHEALSNGEGADG